MVKQRLVVLVFLFAGHILVLSLNAHAQSVPSDAPCPPIRLENLISDIIETPRDHKTQMTAFFSVKVETPSNVTIRYFDESTTPTYNVELKADPTASRISYRIVTAEGIEEWIKIESTLIGSSVLAEASNSLGEERKVEFFSSYFDDDRKLGRVSGILFNDEDGRAKRTEIDTRESAIAAIESIESGLYSTTLLLQLKTSLTMLDELLKVVLQRSRESTTATGLILPEAPPDCNVYCVRVGTVIPVYACSDDVLNCGNCGVDGFYILGGHGCIVICVLHCSVFYPVV